jgi:hypothetical protein
MDAVDRGGHRVYTRPRVLKLGVKEGHRVLLVGLPDDGFADEAREMGAVVTEAASLEDAGDPYDLVFVVLSGPADLPLIGRAKPLIRRDGALWVLRPKGSRELTEGAVMEAGLATGLVDNKVVAFSESLSALRYVHRLVDR